MKKERTVNRVCVCVCVYAVAVFAWCQGRALTRVKIDVRPYQPGGLFPELVVISRIGNRHVSALLLLLPSSPSPIVQGSDLARNRSSIPSYLNPCWKREGEKSNTIVSMKRGRCIEKANRNCVKNVEKNERYWCLQIGKLKIVGKINFILHRSLLITVSKRQPFTFVSVIQVGGLNYLKRMSRMNIVGVYLEIRGGYCGGLRVLRSAVCVHFGRGGDIIYSLVSRLLR